MITDALGNPVVLGNWYGTVASYEGKFFVLMGRAKTIKEDTWTVGLEIIRRRQPVSRRADGSYYHDMKFGECGFKKRTVSYAAETLFPIPAQDLPKDL